ncbi:MAG: DNA topoisomerase IB [Rhodoglobus sp.]
MRLRRSNPAGRGYHRQRSGAGFSYRDLTGAVIVPGEIKDRCVGLAIPPAWTDVWIDAHSTGHIQATGLDAAGRRQYIYHPAWRARQDRVKFDRALDLATSLPTARAIVTRTLRASSDPRERCLAAAFRMLDTGSLRIGSERYTDTNGSHGLSTLLCRHVTVSGDRVALRFPAKSGQLWESEIVDGDLARFVRGRLRGGADATLLSWRHGRERRHLHASEINEYVRQRTGGEFTAKDFRTLRGTVTAARSLALSAAAATPPVSVREQTRAVRCAMEAAATALGNTPAIARSSYVDPRIVDLYLSGSTIDARRMDSAESEVRKLLMRRS